jgi:hypothetical protein
MLYENSEELQVHLSNSIAEALDDSFITKQRGKSSAKKEKKNTNTLCATGNLGTYAFSLKLSEGSLCNCRLLNI